MSVHHLHTVTFALFLTHMLSFHHHRHLHVLPQPLPEQTKKINASIMMFLAVCALPFVIVSSKAFKDMLGALNPGFTQGGHLLGQQTFRRRLLPELFQDVQQRVKEWHALQGNNRFCTVGCDGYETPTGISVTNFGTSTGSFTAYIKTVLCDTAATNADYYVDIIRSMMSETATSAGKAIEDLFAGFVGDNVSTNLSAMARLQHEFPRLFFAGCIPHILSLLCKDVCGFNTFVLVLASVKFMVKFINTHRRMKNLYKKMDASTTTLTLPGATRFCYVALMLESLQRNKSSLLKLIRDTRFAEIAATIRATEGHPTPTVEFMSLVRDDSFWQKVRSLNQLLSMIARACSLSERQGFTSRHVYPLLMALENDIANWRCNFDAVRLFDTETLSKVAGAVGRRWRGHGKCVGAYRDFHVLAWVLNPYTAPREINATKRTQVVAVFQRFYSRTPNGANLARQAEQELDSLLSREGHLGRRINEYQDFMVEALEDRARGISATADVRACGGGGGANPTAQNNSQSNVQSSTPRRRGRPQYICRAANCITGGWEADQMCVVCQKKHDEE